MRLTNSPNTPKRSECYGPQHPKPNMQSISSTAALDLNSLVEKTKAVLESLDNATICRSKEQYHSLGALNTRLQENVAKIAARIECLEEGRAEQTRKDSEKYLTRAATTRASIIEKNQVRSIASFKKSIALIFQGPRDSALDDGSIKSRKRQTRMRCEAIKELNPDGVISWAAGLAPHVWTPAGMKNHVFEYLIEEIEPAEAQVWPSRIREILHVFRAEEDFGRLPEYLKFLTGKTESLKPCREANYSSDLDTQSSSEATPALPKNEDVR